MEKAPAAARAIPPFLGKAVAGTAGAAVRFRVQVRGFRTQRVIVVTSLLDEKTLPDSAIAELYARRWQVELHFRQIKTNLALDVLRGLSPQMS